MGPLHRKLWSFAGVVALVLAAGGAGLAFLQAQHAKDISDPDRARQRGEPIPVRTERVTQSEVEDVIGATVLTDPSEVAIIRVGASHGLTQSALVLKSVNVREGDHVTKGQLLFALDDAPFLEVQKQKEAALFAAKKELELVTKQVPFRRQTRELEMTSAKAEYDYRVTDLAVREKEYKALLGLRDAKLFEQYDAESKYMDAKFNRDEARRHVKRAEIANEVGELRDAEDIAKAKQLFELAVSDLALARRDVERCQITSPVEGISERVDLASGQAVVADAELVKVIRLDPIHARLDYPQDRLDDLKLGWKVEVVLDAFPKQTLTGTVIRISPQVNPHLRILPVVVELANPGYRIKAGISGYARLRFTKKIAAVPEAALIEDGARSAVFRVEDGRARMREVRTGVLFDGGVREVQNGLAPGDEVVIFHNFYRHTQALARRDCYLEDNDLVDVNWRKWARRE
jgi:RND family efflux transporter MFP subunit